MISAKVWRISHYQKRTNGSWWAFGTTRRDWLIPEGSFKENEEGLGGNGSRLHSWTEERVLGKMARNKDKSKGLRITPRWKPKSHRKPRTPNPNGDKLQADLCRDGLGRCCCQFGHWGPYGQRLSLSYFWPSTGHQGVLPCSVEPGAHRPLWEKLQSGGRKCFHFSGKQTNQVLPARKAGITPPPAPQGRVSAVTLHRYTSGLPIYTAQGHTSLCYLGIEEIKTELRSQAFSSWGIRNISKLVKYIVIHSWNKM